MDDKRSSSSTTKGLYKKRKIFKNSWLDNEMFKEWLTLYVDGKRAYCTACDKILIRSKSELMRHANWSVHIDNMNSYKKQKVVAQSTSSFPVKTYPAKNKNFLNKVKEIEGRLIAFYENYDISSDSLSHMIRLLQEICTQQVTDDIALSRRKCTQLVKNVIGKRTTENTVENLKQQRFSVLIDERTIVTNDKILSILVKYVDQDSKRSSIELLELIKLDAKDCPSNDTYSAFKNCLESKGIPLKNIVGMAYNNTSETTENHESFVNKLRTEVSSLILFKYICHCSTPIVNKACSKLPKYCERVLYAIAKYVSNNANESTVLREYQQFFNIESQKVLKLSDTKWSDALQKFVIRILDNWEDIKQYFYLESEKNNKTAEGIYYTLNNDRIKAYMLFLKYSLHFLNNLNALFLSRKILIHKLSECSNQLIRQIGQNFLLPTSLQNISLDIINSRNFLPFNQLYVGPECEMFLVNQTPKFIEEVKLKCLDFYVSATEEMMKLLPFNDTIFDSLKFLDSKFALYYEERSKIKDMADIAMYFGIYDVTTLDFEWRILPTMFNDTDKKKLATLDMDVMWKKIFETKSFTGQPMFPSLEKLVQSALSVPHSNAETERIFSIIIDVRDRKRNRITFDNLNAICKYRASIQTKNANYSFDVDARHLELHNTHNIYFNDGHDIYFNDVNTCFNDGH